MEALLSAIVVGPLMAVTLHLLRRSERREDWARQDAVAAKVADVEKTLRSTDADTKSRLKQIHALVNSNLTAALAGELAALRGQAVALRRLPGADTDEALAELATVDARIAELAATMADRERQTEIGEQELASRNDPPSPS